MRWPGSPTVELLVLFGVVYLCQQIAGILGVGIGFFALTAPLERPWTLITAVYAHANLVHLLTNAIALVLVGLALERFTTRARFHTFVLVTGIIAAVAELLIGVLIGTPVAVLGASGAILALYGYVLAGNRITGGALAFVDLSRRSKVVLLVVVALVVMLLTASPGVALVAHFTGFALGVIGGRRGILRPV